MNVFESPLVLVQNDRTAGGLHDDWIDVEGERYQFPNQYRNKVRTGRPFVYYRGVRRADGSRRDAPEYFGIGRIGAVYLDPATAGVAHKRNQKFFCEIEDYEPFESPVPWKRSDGTHFEQIHANQWGVGVRDLHPDAFRDITLAAGLLRPEDDASRAESEVTLSASAGLLVSRGGGRGSSGSGSSRRSKRSKLIGDAGERLIFQHLLKVAPANGWSAVRWVARDGETPGWDLEYRDARGGLVAVEVKSTTGPRFPSVELTAGEWRAAGDLRKNYQLYLVAGVLSNSPVFETVVDPVGLVEAGAAAATPTVWRFERVASAPPVGEDT